MNIYNKKDKDLIKKATENSDNINNIDNAENINTVSNDMATSTEEAPVKKEHRLGTTILLFVLPYLLNLFVQNLYGAVDLFVVGHFAETADISAVTIGSQIMAMASQLIVGFATAVTVLIGRYFGAKKPEKMPNVFGSACVMLGTIAIAVMLVLIFFRSSIITVLSTPAESFEKAKSYLLYCAFGIIFIAGYNVTASTLMGMGNSRTPFYFICVACVINIGLDFLLVCGFKMGATGAAIATMAAQGGSFLMSVIYIKVKSLGFKLKKSNFIPTGRNIKKLLIIGSPTAVQNVMVSISFLFITATINKMGLEASAAVGVVEKLIVFMMMPSMAFSAAVASISSRFFGANERKKATKTLGYAILFSLVPALILVSITSFAPNLVAPIFSSDPKVIALAAEYLRSYGVDIPLVAFLFPVNGYLASAGYSWYSLVHSLASTFGFRIPFTTLFASLPNTSLFIIGWAAPLSTVVSVLLIIGFFVVLVIMNKRKAKMQKVDTQQT